MRYQVIQQKRFWEKKASEESKQALRVELGLDQPATVQYFSYLGKLLQGDLGTSIRTKEPIMNEMLPYLAATLELAVMSMLFAIIVGINAGILSAWKQKFFGSI